ncbi:glycoside hydrolase family 88 protein [Bacteroides sp. GD17]|jgi:unsaturated chondroitin disaccharide hydrolase|uniref:glycoside hydrolase family 88 protein n=1 Tax=Bacteroides sp. GD17 TaxID=3139826 RepID=UPI00313E0AF4
MKKYVLGGLLVLLCSCTSHPKFEVEPLLRYCEGQIEKSLSSLDDTTQMPRNILPDKGEHKWNCTSIYDWTSGFWPGILWYAYEYSHDVEIKKQAERYSSALYPVLNRRPDNHDLGFMMYCSLGNAYRLTGEQKYKEMLLRAADSLAILFDERVGTIHSWPGMRQQKGWPHNTIIDNMLNLELLFWAARNGGNKELYDIAFSHAKVTAGNQFRDDYSTCHVVVYDTISGKRISQLTHQGYADESLWARGQAWAIYGFTMCYRETGNTAFLEIAQKATDTYLQRLPIDYVPYWDFDAPGIPEEPKDASAAAVVASGLLELSSYIKDKEKADRYFDAAIRMLETLSSPAYLSGEVNNAFLLHSTGHKPHGSEIDASIIYADYYYIEALIRLNRINNNCKVVE